MSDEKTDAKAEETEAEEPVAPETVTLTIDGQEATVVKGTNVLEAAKSLGIEIPAFCYHPGLSIAACCRQCLVTIEKWPKPSPACQVEAGNEMVVHTQGTRRTRSPSMCASRCSSSRC